MIVGEIQTIAHTMVPQEEYFLGRGKDRKEGKGRQILNKVGGVVNSLGGYEGIGRTIDTLTGGKSDTNQPNSQQVQNRKRHPGTNQKNSPPTIVFVLGGLVVVSVVVLVTMSLAKNSPKP